MKARRNQRRASGLPGKSREATLLNGVPRLAKVSPFFQNRVAFGDRSLLLLTKIFFWLGARKTGFLPSIYIGSLFQNVLLSSRG